MVSPASALSFQGTVGPYACPAPLFKACPLTALRVDSLRVDVLLPITRLKVGSSRRLSSKFEGAGGRCGVTCCSSLDTRGEGQREGEGRADGDDDKALPPGIASAVFARGGGEEEEPTVRPPYGVITSLALAGVAETAYLTWTKLLGDGTVTCPLGGDCNDVLNSEYAVLFGLPLSMYGLVAYSAVALLSQLSKSDGGYGNHGHSYTRWLLLGATSLMATASGFFLYLLAFKLDTPSCSYCFASAALSISLFLCSGWGFTMKELKRAALPQLALSMGTVLAFSLAFGDVRSAQAGSREIDLLPLEPEVLTVSTSREVALAKHLKAVGAKMYGAFWCSHCYEQKQMFGREAMKYVEYVECYPDGYRRGVQLDPACEAAGVEGFPTWVVNGKVLPGERSLEELAQASEFVSGK
eukprot:TRINITY_DN19310_c0_g1_i1.p1 TRINITY_DN19310_c0_g1~~TRINITY_DN19310_c0_g1_i1.p1  ORF type:complete len:411 (+),score=62.47 TRINITY_DN19310_c0_g1_i1:86-1318(+)